MPWPQHIAPGPTQAQTERCPSLQHLDSPKGPSCPSLHSQAQQKQEQFLLPETGSCEGSILPSRDGVSQHLLYPHPWGAVPGSVLAARAKPPMLLPGALTDLGQHQELKLVLSPFPHGWVRKRMCLTLSLGVSSSAASLLAALGPSEPWPGVGCLPSGHHLVQPQPLQLLHQVPAEDAAPGCGSILTPGHRGGMGLRILRVLGVE